ncbi:MAG: hypothetical protein JO097_13730 [Acidobacteriaceae bacterium]|nr:hypothetical protein [Acidobacteriaceae bacterium]MBV9295904.1 hypothetical protein [Acidobacteriaceae bacterium]MBV9766936.1 hypothetical protein [Acidobacteriaceae bacterium]
MMKTTAIFIGLALAGSASAQIFSFGIKAGLPLADAYQMNFSGVYQRRYTIGPTAELHLPLHLSFEVDALYRRSGWGSTFSGFPFGPPPYGPVEIVTRSRIDDWEIPFLAKWAPGVGPIRPFIDAGVSYRHLSGFSSAEFFAPIGSPSPIGGSGVGNPNAAGATVGGGLTLKLLVIRISPEIRYTHWGSTTFVGLYNAINTSANQADFLVGLTF